MKKQNLLTAKNFSVRWVGKTQCYFGCNLPEGELCIENAICGFYIALYDRQQNLLLPKRTLFSNISADEVMLELQHMDIFGMCMTRTHLALFDKAIDVANDLYEKYRVTESF